jgi:hypothetical protein
LPDTKREKVQSNENLMEIDQLNVAYYTLEPEVAGGLGDGTVIDTTVHPPHVERLHYEFEDWLGDDLVESFPCFLVSKPLAARLTAAGLGTFQLKDVAVTMTPEAEELLGTPRFRTSTGST